MHFGSKPAISNGTFKFCCILLLNFVTCFSILVNVTVIQFVFTHNQVR